MLPQLQPGGLWVLLPINHPETTRELPHAGKHQTTMHQWSKNVLVTIQETMLEPHAFPRVIRATNTKAIQEATMVESVQVTTKARWNVPATGEAIPRVTPSQAQAAGQAITRDHLPTRTIPRVILPRLQEEAALHHQATRHQAEAHQAQKATPLQEEVQAAALAQKATLLQEAVDLQAEARVVIPAAPGLPGVPGLPAAVIQAAHGHQAAVLQVPVVEEGDNVS